MCQALYVHHLSIYSSFAGWLLVLAQFYRLGNQNSERLNNSSKTSQLISIRHLIPAPALSPSKPLPGQVCCDSCGFPCLPLLLPVDSDLLGQSRSWAWVFFQSCPHNLNEQPGPKGAFSTALSHCRKQAWELPGIA